MPQLRNASGRRSAGRQTASAVSAAARGNSAKRRGIAGLVFEKGELRPTSLRHFFASSSTRIAAARADGVLWLCVAALARTDAIAGGGQRASI